uniref:Uncharacterized protein n=1 Tax=Rhizophora mucronata TaxID=61149 RepID=A0A2P2QDD1_RHIMU
MIGSARPQHQKFKIKNYKPEFKRSFARL